MAKRRGSGEYGGREGAMIRYREDWKYLDWINKHCKLGESPSQWVRRLARAYIQHQQRIHLEDDDFEHVRSMLTTNSVAHIPQKEA